MTSKYLLLLPVLAAAPLGAQQFEGSLNVRIRGDNSTETLDGVMTSKGNRTAIVFTAPASAGPMAGRDVKVIVDIDAKLATMLAANPPGMPAMGNMKGVKMSMKLEDIAGEVRDGMKDVDGELKKVGTSQTIAGTKCDNYQFVTKGEKPVNLCVTSELGHFNLIDPGAMGGANGGPKWARMIKKGDLFPLKVWTSESDVYFEVTGVARKSVPESMFVIPSGYMDASGMMGGMGRRP